MALPTGQISMSEIRNEFKGSSGQIAMSELARGGTYVPPTHFNANIPGDGQRAMSQYRGAGSDIDMDAAYTVYDAAAAPANALAQVYVYANGLIEGYGGVSAFSDYWAPNYSSPGSWYEVYLQVLSGTGPNLGDPINTWLALSSNRYWQLQATADGSWTGTWRVHIRNAITDVTKDYCDISVEADRFTVGGK